MTKQLEILTWCDFDDNEPADTYELELRAVPMPNPDHRADSPLELPKLPTGPREIDLCSTHAKELGLLPLWEAVATLGRAPSSPMKPPAARPGVKAAQPAKGPQLVASAAAGVRHGKPPAGERNLRCPECELSYASMSGLQGHVRSIHGKTMSAAELRAFNASL